MSFAQPISVLSACVASASVLLLYLGGLAIYRLYFSQIARFPGPRLAALSLWYEFYYDVVCGGQYFHKINELHNLYGRSGLPPSFPKKPQLNLQDR